MTQGLAAAERVLLRGEDVAADARGSLRNWYPVALSAAPPGVWWRDLGAKRFTEPFFSDTLLAVDAAARRRCHTPLSALAEVGDTLAPTAFIFHVSRCGSTLLAQALATLPHCIVMSEPPVLDSFLRCHAASDDAAADTFRLLLAALGQRRAAAERHLIVKLDSWHIASLALIRRAFPDTPCLLLYREPGAVLASHRRRRGPQMVPGLVDLTRLALDPAAAHPADLDGYARLVLAAFFAAALAQASSQRLSLLNYNELPGVIVPALLRRWSISCTAQQRALLEERTRFHSKQGAAPFRGDPHDAPPPAGAALAAAYVQLEHLRQRQRSMDAW